MVSWRPTDVKGHDVFHSFPVDWRAFSDRRLVDAGEAWSAAAAGGQLPSVELAHAVVFAGRGRPGHVSVWAVEGEDAARWPNRLPGSAHDEIWSGVDRLGDAYPDEALRAKFLEPFQEAVRERALVARQVTAWRRSEGARFGLLVMPVGGANPGGPVSRVLAATSVIEKLAG